MTSDSLNMAACNEFEASRPRKKARRSCLNCQRAHKTCGNERPCGQCVKRGISSKCVDGNRKLPKYLYEVPNEAVKADFYCTKKNILNTENYGNAATGREASLEEQIQDRRRETSEEVFDEIIDPTFLYTESSSFTYAKHAFVGTTVEDNGNHDPFLRNTQYSPWADASSTESEHSETEKPVQTPENIPGDSLAEPQECEILESQIFSMGSYDEYVIKELACEESSYGFAISSGWSSTFFPSEIEEEPQVSMNMAAKGAKCSHLTC